MPGHLATRFLFAHRPNQHVNHSDRNRKAPYTTSSIDFCNTNTIRGHPLRLNWFLAAQSDRLEPHCRAAYGCATASGDLSPSHVSVGCVEHRPRSCESRMFARLPRWKTEPQLDESRVLVVVHARVRILENTSPHRWESRIDQDPSRNVLPRRNERIEEYQSTFRREGFPHCVTITRHAGRTGLVDMHS